MAEVEGLSPYSAGRRLRAALRRARERAGLTQEQVAAELDWSPPKMMRIESGGVTISDNSVHSLCDFYQLGPAATEQLLLSARAARRRSWWHEYRDTLSPASAALIDLEADATLIQITSGMVVPGVLQVPGYVEAVLSSPGFTFNETRRAHAATVRRIRRERYELPAAPPVEVLIDESVLYRLLGGPETMAEQLLYLAEAGRRPHMDLRIVPFEAGVVGAGSQILLTADDGEQTLYSEGTQAEGHTSQQEVTRSFADLFAAVQGTALDSSRTNHLLHRMAEEYQQHRHVRPWL